jgi:hypothetical protein
MQDVDDRSVKGVRQDFEDDREMFALMLRWNDTVSYIAILAILLLLLWWWLW